MIRWHVSPASDGTFLVVSNAKPSPKAREDHPLYAIVRCELEYDAERIAKLLNEDEERSA